MKTRHLILLASILMQCTNTGNRIPAPEDLYTEAGFAVISTYFNPTVQTTSILFGNAAACESAAGGYAKHNIGEDYCLVTWSQHGNPLWFGGYINGSIKSIEQITSLQTGDSVVFDYRMAQGKIAGISKEQRIAQIFSLKPLMFP